MIWLGFTFLMMLNPIPVLFKPSRWWLIRSVGELFISGLHKVEVSINSALYIFWGWYITGFFSSLISGWGMWPLSFAISTKTPCWYYFAMDPAISFAPSCSQCPIFTSYFAHMLTISHRLPGKNAGPTQNWGGRCRLCWLCFHCLHDRYKACGDMWTRI